MTIDARYCCLLAPTDLFSGDLEKFCFGRNRRVFGMSCEGF
jgi:hypothetical protein